jgi:hypothetical protein
MGPKALKKLNREKPWTTPLHCRMTKALRGDRSIT